MKKIILFIFIISQYTSGQLKNFEVISHPSRVRLSAEEIKTNTLLTNNTKEPNMGFIGHGYEVFGLYPKVPEAYFGVNTYSTITGIRSGFFVFGVTGGYQNKLFFNNLNYDLGLFIGGGGGSGAPDGGGLMIRPHLDISYNINSKLALRAGVTHTEFPTGAISSTNFNIGLAINTHTFITNITETLLPKKTPNLTYNLIEINLLYSNLFNFSKGPFKNNNLSNSHNVSLISLIGTIIKTKQKNNFYGIVKMGGAFVGESSGFMMLLPGLGYQLPLNKWLTVNAQGLIGGAGGGNVQFGGGLATQIEIGADLNISNYLLSINLGNTYAPNGNFKSNHLDISVGKSFELFGNSNSKKTIISNDEVKLQEFNFTIGNRLYSLPNGIGKFGAVYEDYFNLINFELEKNINQKLSILLSTNWAYQGAYGAYAEGWVGMQYYLTNNTKKWNPALKAQFGAGGGGGINLGSGMAFQYSAGIEKEISKRWSFVANVGQVRPVQDGNFTPLFLDLGFKLNLNQLIKK